MISVIIPTLNERENIEPLIARLLESGVPLREIVFVDDGSTDGTREQIRARIFTAPVLLIERSLPALGLAGAVIAGAQSAQTDILVVMDADLSHPPESVAQLVQPLWEGTADLVIGSRYIQGGSTPGWPLWRRIMSRVASAISYPLTAAHDSMGGFFAIRRELLLQRAARATGFKIVFEMVVAPGPKLRVLEVPIAFHDRARGRSKMNFRVALLFAFRWLRALSRLAFAPRKPAAGEPAALSTSPRPERRSVVP